MKNRGLLVALLVVILAGVAFLLKDSLWKPTGGGSTDRARTEEAPAAASIEERDVPPEDATAARLSPGADAAGTGSVTVRLLDFRDKKPIAGQAVRLASSAGGRLERATGEDGQVTFADVKPGNEWTLFVEGPGFSPVEMRGVSVRARRAPTDLGDLLLGDKVALRGRVVDGKGLPVPGASVSAYTGGGLDFSKGLALAMVTEALEPPAAQDEATTDEKGLFVLASLAPGTYRLSTKHPGYGQDLKPDLVVASGRATGLLTIVLGVAATLRGKVTDEKGAPIEGAQVIAVESGGQGFRNPSATLKRDFAVTGADGRYVIDTLNRGASYRYGVSAKGRAPYFDAAIVTAEPEQVRDFVLPKGGAIAGTVTDSASGKPVAGARVLAIVGNLLGGGGGRPGRGGGPAGGDTTASTQTGTTGEDGTFRLEGLKAGPVFLGQVKAPGYADATGSAMGNAGAGWGEVVAGETLVVDVKLDAGGSVTGKVTAAGPNGSVPVVGAVVSVRSFQSFWSGYPTATTGEDGSYRVDGVKVATQATLAVTAAGYVTYAPNPMDAANAITIPEQGGVVEKDVTLSSAGSVEGVVANTKGEPIAGARVRAKSAPLPGQGFRGFGGGLFGGGTGGVVLTDAEGRYRLDGVSSEGRFVVEAETDELVPGESEPFDLKAGEVKKANVVLEGGAVLRGRVVDDHGRIVAGATLRVGRLDDETDKTASLSGWRADALLDQRSFQSDADGYYEVTKVRPGKTLLKAEADGYSTYYRRDLLLASDQVLEHYMITLVKGEPISGVVRGEDGRTLPGAFVVVTKQANPVRGGPPPADAGAPAAASDGTVEAAMNGRTDEQGRYVVENVPPGTTYSVVVWFAQGYRGFAQGDEAAIRRGVSPGSHDADLTLKKADPADAGPGMFPRPVPAAPRAPGPGPAVPTPPAMGPGMGG